MATIPVLPASADRQPLSRDRLFAWLTAIAIANSFAGTALRIVPERGWAYALFELFGISAILWLAAAASIALLAGSPDSSRVRPLDLAVGGGVAAVALLPIATASAIALTLLAFYMIWRAPRGSAAARAGIVCLAMTGSLIWGRLLLALFSDFMLAADSWLVAEVFGARRVANIIYFTGSDTGALMVAPGCSSWQGMSLAIVFWATLNQWFEVRFGWRAAATCLLALLATIAINVLRIGAMLVFPRHLEEIHHGYGWHISMWATLIAVCAICIYGARREIFAR